MAKADLTAQRLRELLDYDPESGRFVWRVYRGRTAKPGTVAGNHHPEGYKIIMICGHSYGAHRLAWLHAHGVMPSGQIDHINGVRNDNRLSNLRDVTRAVNKQNIKGARKDSKASGLVGAYWHNVSKKWFSNIGVNGKRLHLGMFATAEEAHASYIEAKRRLHPGCTI
jgi:hypothetical protein